MSLHPGTRLGPYEVLSSLGAGGMGVVYRARDSRLGRDVAIKALPDPFARDPERLQRFEREAKVLASLSHPHIAAIYGLEEVEGHRYLVLEYVEGPTLAERLKKGPLPLTEALEICRDIAAGLEAAHESGVIHRDLKPGNVMLTPSGGVKVLDFGLAKGGTGSNSESNLMDSPTLTTPPTGAGVILGTAAYMSPEQARGKAVDRRTDIWSFGCVLYECLAGKQIFEGETVSDLIAKILEREPEWQALPASVPPRVAALLRRCLTKDAKQRLRDIGDARLELTEALSGAPEPAAAGVPAGRRAGMLATAGAVVVVAAATFAITFSMMRPSAPRAMRVSVQAPDGMQVSEEVPDITISPDGSMLLFAGQDTAGVSHLWVRPLASAGSRMLPGTEGAKIPFWSPSGREVGFFADENLKRMPIDGENAQIICPAPNPRGGAWGAGDVIVFAPTASGPLMQVPASGGEPKPATRLDTSRGETAHRFPCFLPDGKHFLYVALPGKASQLDTRVGTRDAKLGPVVVTSPNGAVYAEPGYLLFSRQGSVVAQRFDARSLRVSGAPRTLPDLFDVSGSYSGSPSVMTSRNGILVQREVQWVRTRLDVLDRSGRVLSSVSLPDGRYSTPRFSPDGSHVVLDYARTGASFAPVWMVELARGTSSRFTFEGVYQSTGVWTPDGGRVIYGFDRTGGRDLYWKRADGAGAEDLLADVPNLFNNPNSVSPDGRVLVYRSLSGESGEDLWALPLTGERKPAPLIRTRFNELDADISPNGGWIAYRSDESGRFEIYIQSFPALDRKIRVSTEGATPLANVPLSFTRWRNDGRELFYIGGDGQTIMSAAVEPGPDIHVAAPHPLVRVPRGAFGADISPDGQRVLVCMPTGTQGRSLLNLVMNWAPELKESK